MCANCYRFNEPWLTAPAPVVGPVVIWLVVQWGQTVRGLIYSAALTVGLVSQETAVIFITISLELVFFTVCDALAYDSWNSRILLGNHVSGIDIHPYLLQLFEI